MKYVILGGTSGIGLATAKMAVEAGHSVIAAGRDPGKFAEARSIGANTAQLDARDPVASQQFFDSLGEFDHLVLCASGAGGAAKFRELALDEVRSGFGGKFWPQIICAKCALTAISDSGSITLLSAISSRALKPGTAGLAAINSALEAMVPILAPELRPIRVNAVAPGAIDTPWWSRVSESARNELFEQLAKEVAVGRVGKPEDLAAAIMLLTTNTFITGSMLDCDGGWKLKNA